MFRKWTLVVGLAALVLVAGLVAGCGTGVGPSAGTGSPIDVKLSSQQEGIWVNGEGKVTVRPDIANISLGIEAKGDTVSQAQTQAASAMDKVMNALTRNGVAKKDIQTQFFNISPIVRWDEKNQREVILGYRVTNTVSAKIRDVEKAGTVIDAVAEAGGDLTRVNNVFFSVENPAAYHKEAREKAVADAAAKATQLATLTGVRLGKATFISENLFSPPPIPLRMELQAAAKADVSTPISPGEAEITLTVQVVYAIAR